MSKGIPSSDNGEPGTSALGAAAAGAEAGRRTPRPDALARLGECALFAALDRDRLRQLAGMFVTYRIPAGTLLMRAGEIGADLHVLLQGQLVVFQLDQSGVEVELAVVRPGEPVGELAYLTRDRLRTTSVRALEDAESLRITYRDLDRCLEQVPELAAGLLGVLARRLQRSNQRYREQHYRLRTAERSLRELSDFLDLSGVGQLGTGIEGLIKRLVHTASSLLDADRASLFLIDPENGDLWSKVAEGAEVKEIRVPAGTGVAGWTAQRQQLVNIPDAYRDPRFNPAVDKATGYRTRTILCAPVWSLDNQVIGVVQVINKAAGEFSADDESLLRAFAHQAAVAVENFNLYRRMVLSHKRMATLLDITTAVSETLDLGSLITRIVAKVSEALHCDRSSYFVYDRADHELWSMEAHGSELQEIRFSASGGLAGYCATRGEVVRITDAYQDHRFNRAFDVQTGYRTRSVLCVPVLDGEGRVRGVLQVINKIEGLFDEDDTELLKAIAGQIGVAVENARLHARTDNMRRYLESVQESISNAILTLDPEWRIVTANSAATRFTGDGPVGKDAKTLFWSGEGALGALVEAVYQNRADASDLDLALTAFDGIEHTVNVNAMPLNDADGVFQGVVVVLEDLTEEKRVKNTLTRYMAKDIVDRMLQDPEQQMLGGVRSTATVLFSDIRGFTTIAENLTAEQTMDLLNEYFGLMVEEVFAERGVLDKFMGDALMAVYGIPYPQPDDAIRAVRTALRMKQVLAELNARRAGAGLSPIRIGVGINTDEVLSGNMGSDKRMDFTVIGDGVNVSSRLESLNKHYGTEILLSQTTREGLDERFALRPIDFVITKGKSRPIQIYEALGDRNYQPSEAELAYAEALELYRAGDFAAARAIFEAGAGQDGPSAAMAARCSAFMRSPPSMPFDGVWRAEEK